jgi:putative endonuclease
MEYGGCVYILTNQHHNVLYTGVTSDLKTRIGQHRTGFYPHSFSFRYNLYKLVYYDFFPRIEEAIEVEQQIKAGSRAKKIARIESMNPQWRDLWEEI